MGKKNRFLEAKRRSADQAVAAVLAAHSKRAEPEAITTYGDFSPDYRNRIEAYRADALRAPEDWRCRIKSRSDQRRFLDLVRFVFSRHPVPAHLEGIWLDDIGDSFIDDARPRERQPQPARGRGPCLRRWYIIAAQGRSLYREAARDHLSKLEAHHFLTAPPEVACARRAFWYAFARAQADDGRVALNVARTKLDDFSVASTFWRDVARFLARNPAPVPEMNDLIDFVRAMKEEDEDFSLKGRSLAALRRRTEEWHRALAKAQTICGGNWPGSRLPDVDYEAGSSHKRAIWRFRQIKTGNDLYREGQKLRHCVASYKDRCVNGELSIWSLTCEFPLGHHSKGVTMEVRKAGTIVQCRGFANRAPLANELAMVKRWAHDHGLTWLGW
jgi:hypothetical protein